MMKFRRLLVHSSFKRNQLSIKQQCGNDCGVKDVIPAHTFTINAGISTAGWNVGAGTSTAGQNVSAGTSTAEWHVSAGTSTAGRNVNAGTSIAGQKVNAGISSAGRYVNAGTSSAGQNVNADTSTARQNVNAKGNIGNYIFAPFVVYKGKAALSVFPALPTFTKLGSGNHVVVRRGCIMMKFVSAIGEHKYDWEKSQLIALSPTEIGSLISLGPSDSCEFFHDPSMLTSKAGEVRKSLSVKPSRSSTGTESGYFISLVVANNVSRNKEAFTVPVTTAEFAVMKTACSFALPHIMGWDLLTNKMRRGTHENASTIDGQLQNSEWDR